jgi:hypothetical protein
VRSDVHTGMTMEITVFRYVTSCSCIDADVSEECTASIFNHLLPQKLDSVFHREVSKCLPDLTTSHPRRQHYLCCNDV